MVGASCIGLLLERILAPSAAGTLHAAALQHVAAKPLSKPTVFSNLQLLLLWGGHNYTQLHITASSPTLLGQQHVSKFPTQAGKLPCAPCLALHGVWLA